MTTIDGIRRLAALGLVVAAGVRLEAGARGEIARAPRMGAFLDVASPRATPAVSAERGSIRPTLPPDSHVVDGFTIDAAPLGADGGGGVPGGGTVEGGFAGRNGPSPGETTGIPMISLAQARTGVGPAPVVPGVGVGPVVPGIGVGTVMPTPPPPAGYIGPPRTLSSGGFGLGGFGLGGIGLGGFGSRSIYGFSTPYGGYGMSLPPTPELGPGAYRAGNQFAGPDGANGVPADPNASRRKTAGRTSLGASAEDPFDAAARGDQPPAPQIRSKRSRTGRRPILRKPERQPSPKKPESRAPEADPNRPEVRKSPDKEPTALREKPAATTKAEGTKPATRTRSMLGPPQ